MTTTTVEPAALAALMDSPIARAALAEREAARHAERRDALARLGVLPRCPATGEDVLARRERSRGFREPGFAPDPYR